MKDIFLLRGLGGEAVFDMVCLVQKITNYLEPSNYEVTSKKPRIETTDAYQ